MEQGQSVAMLTPRLLAGVLLMAAQGALPSSLPTKPKWIPSFAASLSFPFQCYFKSVQRNRSD